MLTFCSLDDIHKTLGVALFARGVGMLDNLVLSKRSHQNSCQSCCRHPAIFRLVTACRKVPAAADPFVVSVTDLPSPTDNGTRSSICGHGARFPARAAICLCIEPVKPGAGRPTVTGPASRAGKAVRGSGGGSHALMSRPAAGKVTHTHTYTADAHTPTHTRGGQGRPEARRGLR